MSRSRGTLAFWLVTALFCAQIGFTAWSWSVGTGVLWGLSYFFWRRLQVAPAFQPKELQTA